MECKKCGKINYASATVCSACGAPLEAERRYDDTATAYGEPEADTDNYETQTATDDNNVSLDPKPVKKKSKTPLIVGAIIVLVLIIGLIIWLLGSGKSDEVVAGFRIELARGGDTLYVGQEYMFEDTTKGGISWEWDFGNGEQSVEKFAKTIYLKDSVYLVRLIVNGEYTVERNVYVVKGEGDAPPIPADIIIDGLKDAYKEGETIILTDITNGATSTTWVNETTGETLSASKTLEVMFPSAGTYKLSVRNNTASNIKNFDVKVIGKENKKTTGGGSGAPPPPPSPTFNESAVKGELNKLLKQVSGLPGKERNTKWFTDLVSILKKTNKQLSKYMDESNGNAIERSPLTELTMGTAESVEITKVKVNPEAEGYVIIYWKKK
jgi:hypothetical protein